MKSIAVQSVDHGVAEPEGRCGEGVDHGGVDVGVVPEGDGAIVRQVVSCHLVSKDQGKVLCVGHVLHDGAHDLTSFLKKVTVTNYLTDS